MDTGSRRQNRWCTDKLKIKPLENGLKDLDNGIKITSYVAIRFDEKYREGHQSGMKIARLNYHLWMIN